MLINKMNYESDEKIYERQLNINNSKFSIFLKNQYSKYMTEHIKMGLYTESHKEKGIVYDPGYYMEYYNIFTLYSTEIFELMKNIKSMLSIACNEYGIDYDSKQYMIHGWFNYFPIKMYQEKSYDDLFWHDHGNTKNAFHGYYAVNAEPSVTHYVINGEKVDRENKNGRLILAKTGIPHAVGKWNYDEPRMTLAYNVFPLENVIASERSGHVEGPFVPLV